MPVESITARKSRAGKIRAGLKKLYPDADCALNHRSALELLIATILSAQSTDENVNRVTKSLFKKYRTPGDYADAPTAQLEKDVHATGFFRQKTRSIQNACRLIVDRFDGKVPETMEELIELSGVARKTANVLLGTWFGKNEGIAVDTHVGRLAERMALTWTGKNAKDAVKIENDLMQIVPRNQWTFFGHAMIWHGRKVCNARWPDCENCLIAPHCPSAGTFDQGPRKRTSATRNVLPKKKTAVAGKKLASKNKAIKRAPKKKR